MLFRKINLCYSFVGIKSELVTELYMTAMSAMRRKGPKRETTLKLINLSRTKTGMPQTSFNYADTKKTGIIRQRLKPAAQFSILNFEIFN